MTDLDERAWALVRRIADENAWPEPRTWHEEAAALIAARDAEPVVPADEVEVTAQEEADAVQVLMRRYREHGVFKINAGVFGCGLVGITVGTDEDAIRLAHATPPAPEAKLNGFRCHNCKSVYWTASTRAPERCGECRCRDFSAVYPSASDPVTTPPADVTCKQSLQIQRAADASVTLRPITMQDVRLGVGEGELTAADVLAGCNAELRRRGGGAVDASDSAALRRAVQREVDGLREADTHWAVGIRNRLRVALNTTGSADHG